jgi:hypothetical protein
VTRAHRSLALALVAACLTLAPGTADPAAARVGRTVTVSGTGVQGTFPAYAAGVDRYAVRTSDAADGTLDVRATSTDPAARVWVDGRPAGNGQSVALSGLQPGDEVNVVVADQGGRTSKSWIYLPSGFPELSATSAPGRAPGMVFLDIRNFLSSRQFEAVVDENGVPVFATADGGQDFKAAVDLPGHYAIARRAAGGGHTIYELDQTFSPLASHRLDGAAGNTDFHDSQLLPGGGALLMGYQAATRDGAAYTDAVIQVVDAQGHATFTWNSKDHVDPSETYATAEAGGDYAHINALQMMPNGDVVASFRNLSQVMRIATRPHGRFASGDVVWRLGGRRSDFTFPNDADGGPCAQHSVRILPDGHLLLFDNGSKLDPSDPIHAQTADMCPGPGGSATSPVARQWTRIVEYALDTDTMQARRVWQYRAGDRYAAFAGSAQRLANGNTMIGWSRAYDATTHSTDQPMATEVTPGKEVVWSLTTHGAWFSYRDQKYAAPDRTRPEIALDGLAAGAVLQEGSTVVADYGCTDRGGSSLASCAGTVPSGSRLDTSLGDHVLRITATDGAGNRRLARVGYTVVTAHQPDLEARRGGTWVGADTWGGTGQRVTATLRPGRSRTVAVRVGNDGTDSDRVAVRGTAGNRKFRVRYLSAGTDVTRLVTSGDFTTGDLAPGSRLALSVVVTRTARAHRGDALAIQLRGTSVADPTRADRLVVVAKAR